MHNFLMDINLKKNSINFPMIFAIINELAFIGVFHLMSLLLSLD